MNISLIICTCDRSEFVKRLLYSLSEQISKPDQIIVVDASNGPETSDVVELFSNSGLSLDYYHTDKGLTKQRNYGLRKAAGHVIGFFDDDIVPDDDFFEKIRLRFTDLDIDGLVPYIYENNEKNMEGVKGVFFRICSLIWGRKCVANIVCRRAIPDDLFSGIIENVVANGCSFYRSHIFKEFQFAEWMNNYSFGEDMDFGLRVSQKYRVIGDGDARIHHYHAGFGRGSIFILQKMLVYNFVRIVNSSECNFLFFRKLDMLIRCSFCSVISTVAFIVKLRFLSASLTLAGGLCGCFVALPWLFIRK